MITTALAHAHATLHVHPEAVAIAAVCFAASVAVFQVVSAIRRARTSTR